jgi:hypothetical protein
MPESLTLAPTSDARVLLSPDGTRRIPPEGWECLPPGDAGLTRRVKLAGASWTVIEKKGRKAFSKGLWAPRENIDRARRRPPPRGAARAGDDLAGGAGSAPARGRSRGGELPALQGPCPGDARSLAGSTIESFLGWLFAPCRRRIRLLPGDDRPLEFDDYGRVSRLELLGPAKIQGRRCRAGTEVHFGLQGELKAATLDEDLECDGWTFVAAIRCAFASTASPSAGRRRWKV